MYTRNVAAVRPIRPLHSEPAALHAHAMDNLRYIRETMERAGSFTAVPGSGGIAMGVIALLAAVLAAGRPESWEWFGIWIGAAVLATAVGVLAAARKAHAAKAKLRSGPGRKFVVGLVPPILAGAVISFALLRAGLPALIPGTWLLLYGTGVLTGGAASVKIIPVMGICFVAMGTVALFFPAAAGNWFLAAGFGGLHIVFGTIIRVKYGG